MGQLRSMLRALGYHSDDTPAQLLARVDDAVYNGDPGDTVLGGGPSRLPGPRLPSPSTSIGRQHRTVSRAPAVGRSTATR